jgi:V/A-type H+/Na+-transporting ATPase subunit D
MAEQVTPTRSELIKIKGRIKLSQLGHKLLKMKRDGLMYELFAVLPKVKDIRATLVKDYQRCLRSLALAQAFEGRIEIQSVAYSRRTPPTVKVGKKNIMGVVVPRVEADQVKRPLLERGYGVVGTSSLVDELVDAYEALTDQIVKAAELETTLKRILDEVEKTKRRVNALEFKVIPELNSVKDFITLRLEEIERENIFRLKRVKAKNEANAAEASAQMKAARSPNGAKKDVLEVEARA